MGIKRSEKGYAYYPKCFEATVQDRGKSIYSTMNI